MAALTVLINCPLCAFPLPPLSSSLLGAPSTPSAASPQAFPRCLVLWGCGAELLGGRLPLHDRITDLPASGGRGWHIWPRNMSGWASCSPTKCVPSGRRPGRTIGAKPSMICVCLCASVCLCVCVLALNRNLDVEPQGYKGWSASRRNSRAPRCAVARSVDPAAMEGFVV